MTPPQTRSEHPLPRLVDALVVSRLAWGFARTQTTGVRVSVPRAAGESLVTMAVADLQRVTDAASDTAGAFGPWPGRCSPQRDRPDVTTSSDRHDIGDVDQAGATLVEAEAILHQFNAGRPHSFDVPRRRRRARETAEICGACGRTIGEGESVWRVRLGHGHGILRCSSGALAPVCVDCRPPDVRWSPIVSCATCSRRVTTEFSRRRMRRTFCSNRCSWRWYTTRRNDLTADARRRTCDGCGDVFVPARRDALTCSPGCRQRAYRQRRRLSQSPIGAARGP